jgi:hypothetical protein
MSVVAFRTALTNDAGKIVLISAGGCLLASCDFELASYRDREHTRLCALTFATAGLLHVALCVACNGWFSELINRLPQLDLRVLHCADSDGIGMSGTTPQRPDQYSLSPPSPLGQVSAVNPSRSYEAFRLPARCLPAPLRFSNSANLLPYKPALNLRALTFQNRFCVEARKDVHEESNRPGPPVWWLAPSPAPLSPYMLPLTVRPPANAAGARSATIIPSARSASIPIAAPELQRGGLRQRYGLLYTPSAPRPKC